MSELHSVLQRLAATVGKKLQLASTTASQQQAAWAGAAEAAAAGGTGVGLAPGELDVAGMAAFPGASGQMQLPLMMQTIGGGTASLQQMLASSMVAVQGPDGPQYVLMPQQAQELQHGQQQQPPGAGMAHADPPPPAGD